jgi:peptidase E
MTQETAGQIVAMGGGGFSMEPENPLLDGFILSLARRQPARVCFLPTAGGDSPGYVTRFYRAMAARCLASDLTLIDWAMPRRPAHTGQLRDYVAQHDIFYVGGGSTLHLLALWRAHGIDRLLREAWLGGAILAGVSAGMNCWFQASVTDSFGPLAALNDGLALLDGSACPHYDVNGRRPAYHRAITEGMPGGYAADDGAALHFIGPNLVGAVSSRPNAKSYRVGLRDKEIIEEEIPTRYLGPAAKVE